MTSTLRSTDGLSPHAEFRLRGRAFKVGLTAHILAAVGWFGTAVVVAFCAITAATTSDSTLSHALYRTMQIAPWLSIPAGLVAVATGALIGVGTSWGLVRHRWVAAKIAIAVAVISTDALVVRSSAHHAVLTGTAPRPLYGVTIGHMILLAVAASLAIFKPGGRTRWGKRHISVAGFKREDDRTAASLARS
jgi:hypothetical protein